MVKDHLVLLDNSVVDIICAKGPSDNFQYAITARTHHDIPEYKEKYYYLEVIANAARFDHSTFGSGEVFGDETSTKMSNDLLSIAANQREIKVVGKQTNHNQRDDADVIVAGYINNCKYLVSDDSKFMLKPEIVSYMQQYNLKILSSKDFIALLETT